MILLEQLFDNSASARNFQTLARLVPDTGGVTIGLRFGTVTCTWPGGDQSTGAETVTHGLGRVPVGVWVSVMDTPVDAFAWSNGAAVDSFDVAAKTTSAAPAGATTCTVAWLVMG